MNKANMAILLIGTTGSGKSTLGNFLIDPSPENIFHTKPFKTAKDNKPETQYVSFKKFQHGRKELIVIDTPGLNEDKVSDLKHMIQIVENLKRFDSILACAFVVKFNAKIDAHYKTTVKYYGELLPSLFERNVTIVMTDFATDERTKRMREMQGLNVEQVILNTRREIIESGSLSYEPMLFVLDCLPLEEEERKTSLQQRDTILENILSRNPFSSKDLKVAKTPFLKRQDNELMSKYDGEITAYNIRLQQVCDKAKGVLQHIEEQAKEITEIDKVLEKLNSQLNELDSPDPVEVASWSIDQSWQLFQKPKIRFERTTPFRITGVTKWISGHCRWKEYEQTDFKVRGMVEGKFMRGIFARLSLETMKRTKFETEISSLQKKIMEEERKKTPLLRNLDMIKANYKEHAETISLLEAFISEKRKLITELANDYLSLEEAQRRLRELELAL